MNKTVKIVFYCIVAVAIMSVTMAPTSRQGQVRGNYWVGTSSATLNGTATITGTPFQLKGSNGNISIFYQAIQATSTPHYRIACYTSPDNGSYTTEAVATMTPSNDETTTNFMHRAVSLNYTPWARIDIIGVDLNAEGTTINMWIGDQ